MKKLAVGLTVLALTTGSVLLTPQAWGSEAAEACPSSYLAPLPGSYVSAALTAADPSGRYQVARQ
jgi:hypothetical protein